MTADESHPPQGQNIDEIKARLCEEFGPSWSIVYSSRGRWWAFRGPMTSETFNEVSDVEADSPEDLRAKLLEVMS
ncbi:hypothetical protein GCM10023085_45190 [Actinomadura viridis]|uniref:Uncharacterized protein n=1 Tax=Actinomadura viridis TaxID=58110 RepID=A0A931DLP2_9ACTN|nr:hypothetical protein [Actinomadura viridis]MBG6089881.1 hypothetical protein [Actinomadura viridis]